MSLAPDLKKALTEAFELEEVLKPGDTIANLEAAVEAVLETYRRTVTEEIAIQAETHANALDLEAELDEGETSAEAAGMRLFAHLLRKHETPKLFYQPEHLDLVAVTIAGEVHLGDGDEWSIIDDATGDEFFFSSDPSYAPQVRIISRAREEFGVG